MKEKLIIISKIILGILSIILPFIAIVYLLTNVVRIYEYDQLKWIALLICALGFYISGIINRKTPLKLIPLLYISLFIFIPMRCFYFPLIYFLVLFSTISLILTRKEFNKKIKLTSMTIMSGIFIYFLFSQPLIIKQGETIQKNQYGDLINGKTIWDFSKKKSKLLPESTFLDSHSKLFDLKSLKDKTLYISFWATWCRPCHLEKPELEKLKADFGNNKKIVFIDISVDSDQEKWKEYIEINKPSGIQLISKDYAKTRNLFELSGIPAHIVVNTKGELAKERTIKKAYSLLSDSIHLNDFINRKLPKETNSFNIENYRMVKYVEFDSINTVYYTTNEKDRLIASELNDYIDTLRKEQKSKFINLLIEKHPIQDKDSIIYKVVFNKSKVDILKMNQSNK
ncbi:TlpA family protein disulfide reductase [Ichthyenterobacterium magnum]|uniref:Thiol-disulfide isomerase/thioredoxin n=1 Tax=Ichthyenterobacterium magnum TaxID=1230530 RepID=A0A420DC66_9FLAO|nr:TlpA disulfide reductase family protein [Ichthyenterobacterium magnum]RKE89431.1 thiol-disulfide isomerase/thioredoxin [Ichthyenterobacterium magnum]